jgi:hypothetical protein
MTVGFSEAASAACGEVVVSRRRGKSQAPNFRYEGPVSVICLELDVNDPVVRRRVQAQWAAVFRLRRACNVTPSGGVGRTGRPIGNAAPTPKRCASGWVCRARRHLFADASGCRHGPPRIGSWWDFTRIPGPSPFTHQGHPGVGNLAAGRHPGRAPGRLPAPRSAPGPEHCASSGPVPGRNLDPVPAHGPGGPAPTGVGEVG